MHVNILQRHDFSTAEKETFFHQVSFLSDIHIFEYTHVKLLLCCSLALNMHFLIRFVDLVSLQIFFIDRRLDQFPF